MTVAITVKYNGTAIDDVTNLTFDNMINGIGPVSFNLNNFLNDARDTWTARRFLEKIEIFRTSDSTLLWSGYITHVSTGHPMKISCKNVLDSMDWDYLTENAGNFIVDDLLIQAAPEDANLRIKADDVDNPDPGYSTSDARIIGTADSKRYAIISDDTLEEAEVSLKSNAPIMGVWAGTAADHTNTQTSDATYWEIELADPPDEDAPVWVKIPLQIQDDTIPVSEQITKIQFNLEGYGYHKIEGALIPKWADFRIAFSKDGTTADRYLWNRGIFSGTFGNTETFFLQDEFTIEEGTEGDWFDDSGANFSGGYILFEITENNALYEPTDFRTKFFINYIEVIVYHSGTPFERMNKEITGCNDGGGADVGYDIITVSDGAGGNLAMNGKGLNVNDKISISKSILEGFNLCAGKRGFNCVINDGTDPARGTTQNYVGISYYDLWLQLCDQMKYDYFIDYSDGTDVVLRAIKEDDIAAAATTYSKDNSPPSWNSPIRYEANQYGFVVVQYYNGALTEAIVADTPLDNPRTKLMIAKWIMTYEEAYTYGKLWANYYAETHLSISLHWGDLPTALPKVGTKYNATLLKFNGTTIENDSFTEQVCRRVSFHWDGGQSPCSVDGWFGTGHTDPDEKEAMWGGKRVRNEKINNAMSGTAFHTWITRYNQLLGRPDLSLKLNISDIDDAPVNAETEAPISSNWAFDHKADPSAHHSKVELESAPTNGVTTKAPNSDWGYKIENEAFTKAGVQTFSSFPITPSAAPTTNYQTANKKYVDDNATPEFHKRGTDAAGYDYDKTDFTIDFTWREKEISAIVTDASAYAVLLLVILRDGSAQHFCGFKSADCNNSVEHAALDTQVSNVYMRGTLIVACDSNQKIDYRIETGMDNLYVHVLGWWK